FFGATLERGAGATSVGAGRPAEETSLGAGRPAEATSLGAGRPAEATSLGAGRPAGKTSPPSIIVDSLGTGALNFVQIAYTKKDTRTPMLQRRGYKLVMFQVGTNTFMLERHKDDVKRFLAELRETLPGVSILL